MTSKLTILGFGIFAWAGVVGVSALALPDIRFTIPLVSTALAAATAGLVLSIIGAARHEPY